MKKLAITAGILLFISYFLFCFISSLFFYDWDHFIYSVGASRILHGQTFGLDFLDTKFATFFYIYAFLLKIFTHGVPYYPFIQNVFVFLTFIISSLFLFFVCEKLYKNKWISFIATFFYIGVSLSFGTNPINSEFLQNIFILIALFLFINKKGEFGFHFFWVGFFIALASFVRIPAFVNYFIFTLFLFLYYYKPNITLLENIRVSISTKIKPYLLMTLGFAIPWLLLFLHLWIHNRWEVVSHYVAYIHNYSSLSMDYSTILQLKYLLLHALFFAGFFILFQEKKVSLQALFFIFCFFAFNLIFNFLALPSHFEHYYISVFLFYPFIISQAVFYAFKILKEKFFFWKKVFPIFYIILFCFSFFWLGICERLIGFINALDYLKPIRYELNQNGYSFHHYLEAQHVWYRKMDFNFQEIAQILKNFYHTDTQKNITLLTDLKDVEISIYNNGTIAPDLDFTEYFNLNPCFIAYDSHYDLISFYRNMPPHKYFSDKILILTYQKDLSQEDYHFVPLSKLLIENNWDNQYKRIPVASYPLRRGIFLYVYEWNLIRK